MAMPQQIQILAIVALCGSVGAIARYLSVQGATLLLGDRFPYGTLLVNVLGCAAIGVVYALFPLSKDQSTAELWLRYGLMIGFLGAYTTFSAFSLDTLRHLEANQPLIAATNIAANVLACLIAVWLGTRIGAAF